MIKKRISHTTEKLKHYMRLSPKKKLQYLQQINLFLAKAMPVSSKRAWKILQKNNW